jgi:hypothetical protein
LGNTGLGNLSCGIFCIDTVIHLHSLGYAREEQAAAEQQQWQQLQAAAQLVSMQQSNQEDPDQEDYS